MITDEELKELGFSIIPDGYCEGMGLYNNAYSKNGFKLHRGCYNPNLMYSNNAKVQSIEELKQKYNSYVVKTKASLEKQLMNINKKLSLLKEYV